MRRLVDSTGADVSITNDWRSTLIGERGQGSGLAGQGGLGNGSQPGAEGCHREEMRHLPHPDGREAGGDAGGAPVALSADGFLNPMNPLHEAAQDGVSCSLCHQIQPDNLGTTKSFSGGYTIDTRTEPPDRVMFGPYETPFGRPMQMHTGYVPTFGEHTNSAAFCGTCHNLITPYVDAAARSPANSRSRCPTREWENSAFGQGVACQSVPHAPGGGQRRHLADAGRAGPTRARLRASVRGRQPFHGHPVEGSRRGTGRDPQPRPNWTPQPPAPPNRLGRGAGLTLKSANREGDTLAIQLQVSPATGHEFPHQLPLTPPPGCTSPWPMPRGRSSSSRAGPGADGSIQGNVADADPAAYEPHHAVITAADQVQIYEP